MLVSIKNWISIVSATTVMCASAWGQAATPPAQAPATPAPAGQAAAAAGAPAAKEWKDRAEYDLYDAITKETNYSKRLETLNQWRDKYAATNYAKERLLLYLDAYKNLNQAQPMFETAKAILALEPKEATALYYLSLLTPYLPNAATNADVLSNGEKGSRGLIENLDMMRPAGMADEMWKKTRPEAEATAYKTLGWIAMVRKDAPAAQENFTKSLTLNPNQGEVSYWMGNTLLSTRNVAVYPQMLFHMARAVAYDGPGSLAEAGRKQIDGTLTKAYKGYHGDESGLPELKATAKANALPPADYKLLSVTDVEKAKSAQDEEFAKSNPELARWKLLKAELAGANGQQYFDSGMKDAALPKLSGKVVAQTAKALTVAIDGTEPEVTLELAEGTFPKVEPGTPVSWEGVGKAFTKEPFNVTIEVEKSKMTGLPAAAAAKKPAGAKRPAAGKRRR